MLAHRPSRYGRRMPAQAMGGHGAVCHGGGVDNAGFAAFVPSRLSQPHSFHQAQQFPLSTTHLEEHHRQMMMAAEHGQAYFNDGGEVPGNEFLGHRQARASSTAQTGHPTYYQKQGDGGFHPSFFMDSFGTTAEESTLFRSSPPSQFRENYHGLPMAGNSTMSSQGAGAPLAYPSVQPVGQRAFSHSMARGSPMLAPTPAPAPGLNPAAKLFAEIETGSPALPTVSNRVHTNVDPSQYEPISDWSLASVCFEDMAASSPESMHSHETGPTTPGTMYDGAMTAASGGWMDPKMHGLSYDETAKWQPGHELAFTRWRSLDGSEDGALAFAAHQGHVALGRHESDAGHHAPQKVDHDMTYVDDTHGDTGAFDEASPPVDAAQAELQTQTAERKRRDEFLLSMREKGMSYRDIKRKGKFREAESTLRGRVRVLTKAKEDRVRKPAWNHHDVSLSVQSSSGGINAQLTLA